MTSNGATRTLTSQRSDKAWDTAERPGSVTPIKRDSIAATLTRLGNEARLSNQEFLAHLIGMAALEAERLENDQPPAEESAFRRRL